jgi:polysaccharide biosynthesis PFTS motif protein
MMKRYLFIMKGYKKISNSNIEFLESIQNELSETQLIDNKIYSNDLFDLPKDYDLSCRQYLLTLLGGNRLNKEILYSIGNNNSYISYPLPNEWINVLKNRGINISVFNSNLKYKLFILTRFSFGLFYFLKMLFIGLNNIFKSNKTITNYIYFDNLSKNNISDSEYNYDIIHWYDKNYKKNNSYSYYLHSVPEYKKVISFNKKKIIYNSSPIPEIINFKILLKFIFYFILFFFTSIFDLFKGKYFTPLLFLEHLKSKIISLQKKEYLANEYLFNNSGILYRPLWTYVAENRGVLITLYFYSTNCEPLVLNNMSPQISHLYNLLNWPNYLVWDQEQCDFIKKKSFFYKNINIVGPIWFSSKITNMPKLPNNFILVFDVQPVRDFYYQTLGLNFNYYTPEICNQFLSDIFEVFKNLNFDIVHKRKRNIGNLVHYKYINLLKNLQLDSSYTSIDADVAPQELIPLSKCVISMPYTSTAIIAKKLDKISIYYDPTNMLNENDKCAHGITIISGINSLRKWAINNIYYDN